MKQNYKNDFWGEVSKQIPQQYADLRHDLKEQMQILQFEPITTPPVNISRIFQSQW